MTAKEYLTKATAAIGGYGHRNIVLFNEAFNWASNAIRPAEFRTSEEPVPTDEQLFRTAIRVQGLMKEGLVFFHSGYPLFDLQAYRAFWRLAWGFSIFRPKPLPEPKKTIHVRPVHQRECGESKYRFVAWLDGNTAGSMGETESEAIQNLLNK